MVVFLICSLDALSNFCVGQEGAYVGAGLNTYFMREQLRDSNNQFLFTHATSSSQNGFLTQSLGDYGGGIHTGYRKIFSNKSGGDSWTVEGQLFFNHQNVAMENDFSDFRQSTAANYNYGFRTAFGYMFESLHAYLIVQAAVQNVTSSNSSITNNGIIYDVADDGDILSSTLSTNGNKFSTEVVSFIGGFGVEVPLNDKLSVNLEYVPLKHLEYAIRDIDERGKYFVNELVLNQLHVGFRYWIN